MATKPLDTFYFHLLWMCAAAGAGLTDFPFLRFDGGDKRCEGVIQHGHGNSWLPLCITYFTQDLVSLICREMKCGPPISDHPIELRPLYNSSTALNVSCPILEDWRNCSVSPIPAAKCDGAAFLYCAEERQLRLSGGGSSCAGRVEVLKDDVWGAVCDDHWDALDAAVACRQLGCGSALAAYGASHFGVGPPQIHLDDVKCLGSERFLWECPSERRHDCTEREHAGVLCTGHREVRLSGGPNNCWGRLEVYMDGVWGTVCDGSWYDDDSDKVCKALGCESFVKNTKYEHTLSTSVTFLCSQSYSLWECKVLTKNPNTCRQAKAVGIVCNTSPGSSNLTKARLQQSYNSTPASGSPEKARFRLDGEHRRQELSPDCIGVLNLPDTIEEFPTNNQPLMDTVLKDMLMSLTSSLQSDLASYIHKFNNDLEAVENGVEHVERKMGEFATTINDLIDANKDKDEYTK
ncbi:T-cell differentiation antigen CD6-like [Lithobates pipiens]